MGLKTLVLVEVVKIFGNLRKIFIGALKWLDDNGILERELEIH
jgi:hypothetical protein